MNSTSSLVRVVQPDEFSGKPPKQRKSGDVRCATCPTILHKYRVGENDVQCSACLKDKPLPRKNGKRDGAIQDTTWMTGAMRHLLKSTREF